MDEELLETLADKAEKLTDPLRPHPPLLTRLF